MALNNLAYKLEVIGYAVCGNRCKNSEGRRAFAEPSSADGEEETSAVKGFSLLPS